jgi:mRNA interferase HigB
MKIIGREKLNEFKNRHPDACSQIDSWEAETEDAEWNTPQEIKRRYVSASFLADNQVIFNIKGNKYRMKVQINYANKIVLVKKVGTHSEYMKW